MEFAFFGVVAIAFICLCIFVANKEAAEAKARLELLLARMRTHPTDRSLHKEVVSFLNLKKGSLTATGHSLYEEVLTILEEQPNDVGVRDFALQIGRWHYSRTRPDGKPTVYDEQAILNDMTARASNGGGPVHATPPTMPSRN